MKAQVTETVTIAQAKTALEQTAALYFTKDEAGRYLIDRRRARPVCLMGPAGVGKTEIVRQVAEEQGLAFLSYSVTHHTRQSAIGLPRLIQRELDGKSVSMTEYTMSEIIAEVYRTMEESGKQEGILFLDEFNCASETLRPIMLQLLQAKTFGPHAIPEGWMLVLAGNPSEYNAAATAMDAVTADRMRLLWLRPDYAAWREYMTGNRIHPIVLSYLDDHRGHFYQYERGKDGTALVTARGWEDLSVMLRMMEAKEYPVDLPFIAQFIQSAAVAREFLTWYSQYAELVQSGIVEKITGGKHTAALKKEIGAMDFMKKWALTSVLLMRLETVCDGALKQQEALEKLDNVLKLYLELFSGQHQLEFLVNGVTACDGCVKLIAENDSQTYREAATQVYFQKDTPSSAALRKLLDKKRA